MSKKGQISSLSSKVLRHMQQMAGGRAHGSILLAGDPGVGKTSFVETLSSLMGIRAIVIEVPHITEEHLINIPFLVFNPATQSAQGMKAELPLDEYEIVLAQSNLYSQMVSAQPISDQQYLDYMNGGEMGGKRVPGHVQQLFKQMGGTETKIPDLIQRARAHYKVVLFLDEYFRQSSQRIRNILRGILNNKIGIHRIPKTVYVMYASNMRDEGLDPIQSNYQFKQINYRTPNKDEWFDWFISKHKDAVDERVIQKFQELLTDEDMSFQDVEASVRTSPRRWEQMLLYIGSSLPVESKEEAGTILTYVKNNFVNYQTGGKSSLSEKVYAAVEELIRDTSNIQSTSDDEGKDWRNQVDHAVKMQMKLGERRKYIPVVSGAPGIGKTYEMHKVAEKHNLLLIDIDVSELNPEDVIGIPIPGARDKGHISVKFSLPALFQRMQQEIKNREAEFAAKMKEEHGADAPKKIKEFQDQKWKYLIFFDEISRTDERTFNALRKVILEKNFGPAGNAKGENLKLPEGSIVVAAMNPPKDDESGQGTTKLTSHFSDVIDVIPANPTWAKQREWMMSRSFPGVDQNTKNFAMQIIDSFVEKFKSRDDKYSAATAPFHLDLGTEMYLSPREYTDMFTNLVGELDTGLDEVMADPNIDEGDLEDEIADLVADALEDSLQFVFTKHQIEPQEFLSTLRKWAKKINYSELARKKVDVGTTIGKSLENYLNGNNLAEMPKDLNFINVNNANNNAQVIEQIKEMFGEALKDEATVKKYVLDDTEKKVEMDEQGRKLESSQEATFKVANFVLAYLYSLKIHDYSNDRLGTIGKALSISIGDTLKKLTKAGKISEDTRDEAAGKIIELRSHIQDLITA